MLHLIPLLGEACCEGENTANQFFGDVARVFHFFPVEAPYRLSMTVLKVEIDGLRDP